MLALMFKIILILSSLLLFSSSVTKIDRYGFSFTKHLFAKTNSAPNAPLYLMVSAIWEGSHIRSHNITALQEFRRRFGGIPLTHFISPAYFLRDDKNGEKSETLIRSTILVQDELGLVLHPWRSLAAKSGVLFRKSPTFWGNQITDTNCKQDCGGEVPLAVYNKDDISKLMTTSVKTLDAHGFTNLKSFMAGGWMATPEVLSAAAANQFKFDYSAVSQHLLRPKLEHYPLYDWIGEVWQNVTPYTQPYKIDTKYGELIEIGNSATMIDYLSTQEVIDLFATYLAKKRANPTETLTFHIGFHQETAHKYLPRLEAALQHIFATSSAENIVIKPLTLPAKHEANTQATAP
jgi:hypothetical protein